MSDEIEGLDDVEVTPAQLHEAGNDITTLRERMADMRGFNGVMENVQNPYAADHAGRLSGAFFQPSLAADNALHLRSQEIMELRADLEQNLAALSSALHIVADVYTSADLKEAVDFAFVDTDTVPVGLPGYLDPNQTYSQLREEAQEQTEAAAGHDGEGMAASEEGTSGETAGSVITHFGPLGGGVIASAETFYDANEDLTHTELTIRNSNDGTSLVVTIEDGEQTSELHSPDQQYASGRRMDEIREQADQAMRDAGLEGS